MRRPLFALAVLVVSGVFAACIGDDPTVDTTAADAGAAPTAPQGEGGPVSDGATDGAPNVEGGLDAGPRCGYPGEACCTAPSAPCRVGTACKANKCTVNDAWVVGYRFGAGLTKVGVSAHYDGTSWKEGPIVETSDNQELPIAVWGLAPGSYTAVNTAGDALLLTTDSWRLCGSFGCSDPNTNNQLSSILGFSNNDYWVAGNSVMVHCTGAATCAPRNTGLPPSFAVGVLAGTSSSDLWYSGGNQAFHYDGMTWSASPGAQQARAIWARAKNDVWAGTTTLQHFDGNTWSNPMLIGAAPAPGTIESISGTATDDVWAVGSNGSNVPFTAHYDGTAWKDVPIPAAADQLGPVWAVSKDEVFLTSLFKGIYKWDGVAWTLMQSAVQDSGAPVFQSWSAVTGSARPRP